MEPFAAKTVLTSLVTDYELDIATFTTDRSSSMRTLMREPGLSHIGHEFDPWHWISMKIDNTLVKQIAVLSIRPEIAGIKYLYLL